MSFAIIIFVLLACLLEAAPKRSSLSMLSRFISYKVASNLIEIKSITSFLFVCFFFCFQEHTMHMSRILEHALSSLFFDGCFQILNFCIRIDTY